MTTLYEASTTATGGRKGHVESANSPINFNLSVPKSMGGDGGTGANPEQLFGAAYAACFGGAIEAVAQADGIAIASEDLQITAIIGFCKDEDGFFFGSHFGLLYPGS